MHAGKVLLAACLVSPAAQAGPQPAAAELVYEGNGCPTGSVQGYLADTGVGYRVRFREFVVSALNGSAYGSCRFHVKITPEKGYQIRPKLAAFDSFARIPPAASGYLSMSYRMGQESVPVAWERFFASSVDPQAAHDTKEVDTPQNLYSTCGSHSDFSGSIYAQVDAGDERAILKVGNQTTQMNVVSWEWEQRPCCYKDERGVLTCGDHG